jgi:hypothetical protein
MAVELAKVSLWLDCFTLGAPLSFLDHHLRCGNSLIGAMAQEVEEEMQDPRSDGQMTFLTGPFAGLLRAAEIMRGISSIADVTLEQVRESGHLFDAFDEAATPYKQLLDIHVARHFGVERAEEFLTLYGAEAMDAKPEELGKPYREVVEQTRELYEEKRFFHWDLEFPEVFIDLERTAWKKDGGFDAVVGNPPWIMVQAIDDSNRRYYREQFEAAHGKFDIYGLFIEQGLNILKTDRPLGLIVSDKFLAARYGDSLRDLIITRSAIQEIIDYADLPLFGEAVNYSLILVLRAGAPSGEHSFMATVFPSQEGAVSSHIGHIATDLESSDCSETFEVLQGQLEQGEFWDLMALRYQDILLDAQGISDPLAEYCQVICKGVWTGRKEVFVDYLTEETVEDYGISAELLLPVVDGRDIHRYYYDADVGKRILYPYRVSDGQLELVDIDDYPGAKEYLESYRSELEDRRSWGQDITQAGRAWYEIWNPSPHLQKPKILTQDISNYNKFALDGDGGLLAMDTCYALILNEELNVSPHFLLSVLNSNFLTFIFSLHSPKIRGGFHRYKKQYLEPLPIRRIHFVTGGLDREKLRARLVSQYGRGKHRALLAMVERLLPKDAERGLLSCRSGATGAEEKSDVVHDLLAYLSEQMIAMHGEKQEKVEAFWDDLEEVCDSPGTFEELHEHGKWEQSLWKDPACRPYVDKESRSTRHLDESLGWNEGCYEAFAGMLAGKTSVTRAMIDVYQKHHAEYKALVERIEATDGLIDEIVYRLYGLTEEEIAVVKEGTPSD